jgi:hypothetical protein
VYVKCKTCNDVLKYLIGCSTTSNLREHAKKHGYLNIVSNGSHQRNSEEDEQGSPYNIYHPKFIEITKRAVYHIIKAKLPLNHISSSAYLFVLQEGCER